MKRGFELFPQAASSFAFEVDQLYFFLIAVSGFFIVLIWTLVLVFAVKYRKKAGVQPATAATHPSSLLEIVWIMIPLALTMVMFFWGAFLFYKIIRPPKDAWNVFVVGKQWMWKLQHENGRREINELHVPVGQAIKLTMASQDVIHSFYVPAFRIKMDVVPGRYTTQWFKATQVGEYHLFCAEYCGTQHSGMIGRVVVMNPVDYEKWMDGRTDGTGSMADQGKKVFTKFKCDTCHTQTTTSKAPTLQGLFGKTVKFKDGSEVKVDEAYLRESILKPNARLVEGYDAAMPTFQGQIGEDEVLQVIAYIKSLSSE